VNWLESAWRWLSNSGNRETLALIGSAVVVVFVAAWQIYLHFFKKDNPPTTVMASRGSVATGGDVSTKSSDGGIANVGPGKVTVINIGITPEQHDAILKRREQEIRAELAAESAEDKEKIALLKKELADVQAKLRNPDAALEEYKNKLTQAYRALDDLKQEIPLKQLEQAQQALAKGQSGEAEILFQKVRSQGKEKAAEANFQLAQLAESRIDYAAAYRYSKEAADLRPDNPIYLNQAGLIAQRVGRYSEAEPLYNRALAIDEKAYGLNHPEVATDLNNLAALYKTQGRYAQAEPLYKRSLAIKEKALGPDHPAVATSLNNLAELYRTQGQYAQAEPLYKRALAIKEKTLGPNHPSVATSLENLAALYRVTNRMKEAEVLEKRAAAIRAIKR